LLRHFLLPGLLTAAFALGAGDSPAADTPHSTGSLVIIGGGDRPASISEKFIQLAGGAGAARLVIIPLASEDAKASGRACADEFKTLGISRTDVLPAGTEEGVKLLKEATGVYLTGGDQRRLASALIGTPVLEALRELWQRGGVIAGTSAGAAVMSRRMLTGEERGGVIEEERFRSIQRDQVVTTSGLGFLDDVIIDQHFIARRRFNRLLSVVLEEPKLLGIGIDESTAIVVGPDHCFEVFGDRSVMVIDARHVEHIRAGTDRRLAATDVRVHLLVAGDRFDLNSARMLGTAR
jgi:cyanophycinase